MTCRTFQIDAGQIEVFFSGLSEEQLHELVQVSPTPSHFLVQI